MTEREVAVLRLRSKGYDVPEIAEQQLSLSVATVRVHVRKLVAKLEAKDLTHALAVAYGVGTDTSVVVSCVPILENVAAPKAIDEPSFPTSNCPG